MLYHNYPGVHCKFRANCKHIHAPKGSAARCVFEQDLTDFFFLNCFVYSKTQLSPSISSGPTQQPEDSLTSGPVTKPPSSQSV